MNDPQIKDPQIKGNKKYRFWKKWMELGEKTGCHQKAGRSLFIKGYQMPVCSRCFGVIIGYTIAILSFFLMGINKFLSIGGCLTMLIDWFIQAIGIRKSTNSRRLITGILGGFGIMSLQLHFIKQIFIKVQRL